MVFHSSEFLKYIKKKAREIKKLATADVTAVSAEAKFAGQKVVFNLNTERRAAWKLYVELSTRIATQPLKEDEGLLREALSSLHAVFAITREVLKEAGPGVAEGSHSLGAYAMAILNDVLRPFLAKWHPALSLWEQQRKPGVAPVAHESKWEHAAALRRELAKIRKSLLSYCRGLGILAGVIETP